MTAVTLKGRWHYLEHDWWAEEGGFSMEPPGETHTLEVPEDCQEMMTLFHVIGAYVYVSLSSLLISEQHPRAVKFQKLSLRPNN